MTSSLLPYSVSTGSAYSNFEKLQGVENYVAWKSDMRTVPQALRQWGMVEGTITRPVPANANNITATETAEIEAWDLRSITAFMEISFRVAGSVKVVLGHTTSPKEAWDILEKRYGAKQGGLRQSLVAKLQLAEWNAKGAIRTHRDYMVGLRTQLSDAGMGRRGTYCGTARRGRTRNRRTRNRRYKARRAVARSTRPMRRSSRQDLSILRSLMSPWTHRWILRRFGSV